MPLSRVFIVFKVITCRALILLLATLVGCGGKPVEEIKADPAAAQSASQPVQFTDDDWPWWRGPDRNGIARGPAPPVSWSETENILWKADIPGRGHSSPIVVGDRVYLTTAEVDRKVQAIVALDRETGELAWRSEVHDGGLPTSGMHEKSTHANGTPAWDGQKIYIGFLNSDHIHATALDSQGAIVWQTQLGTFRPKFGYAPSPVIHEGLVIFAADNPGSGFIAAVRRDNGEIVWRKPRKSTGTYSTPSIVSVDGQNQLVISGIEQIVAYDPLTGEELWTCPGCAEATVGTIVWDGNVVFASGGYPGSETICVDATAGKKVWSERVKAYEQSMLVHKHHLYAFADGGILYCLDGATGEERWKKRLGGNVSASLVAHGDVLFATNEEGTTWAFRAGPGGYEKLARNQLGREGFATPTIVGGRIYIRTATGHGPQRRETLYCIGPTTSETDPKSDGHAAD